VDPEPGEKVFFHGHPSWRSMVDFYVKGLVGAVLAGALAGVVTALASGKVEVIWVLVAVLVLFLLLLIRGLLARLRTTYTITDQRLTVDRGLLRRDVQETRLERVQNVNSRQSVLERILRVGTVEFDTAGSAEYDFSFRGVSDPHRIARTVDRALRELDQPHAGV
jgi:uncharacterized membrane protein YdbT with pleckstrin-like domain